MEKIELRGFISSEALKRLREGQARTITLFKETDLHHIFGDNPEESAKEVRVTIEEVAP